MALKLKYKDEHGILHINMSPSGTPKVPDPPDPPDPPDKTDITDPKFDSINSRFGQYDLFGGKYDSGGDTPQSLFRSRYNSIEEELANTPYAFATERSLRLNNANQLDITISSRLDEASPSKDIEDDRFFRSVDDSLFGPQIESNETPAFTITQLIHAQDRYFDLSSRQSSVTSPKVNLRNSLEVRSASAKDRTVRIVDSKDEAFKVLCSTETTVRSQEEPSSTATPVVPTSKRKRESSFAIIAEPVASRPSSPRSLPVEIRTERVSPFKGRGFRESTSRHNTPRTSAANSRANSPPRRRTNSLPRIDKMATTALPPPILNLSSRPHSPRNFLKENIEEVRELSELNREKHEAEAERKRQEEEEALLKEMGLTEKNAKSDAIRSVVCSRATSRSSSPNKISLRSRSNSPSAILHFENIPTGSQEFINKDDGMPRQVTHKSRLRSVSRSQPQSNDGSPKHSKIPKRQSSVSPARTNNWRDRSNSRNSPENNLNKSQRFISNSTSSFNETIKVGSQTHDKRAISKSTQFLNIAPAHIRGKPPISPGRNGPPPANKSINAKRLSPIVGTPNKSPVEDLKPKSAKTPTKPSPLTRKSVKTAGNTPATSRLNSRQPSRTMSRDTSPDKRKANTKSVSKPTTKSPTKPISRAPSTKTTQKTTVSPTKPEPKKPMNRTNSMKSLIRTPSTRTLNEKPPFQKRDSKKDLSAKTNSTSKINEVGTKKDISKQDDRKSLKSGVKKDKISPKKADNKTNDTKTSAKKVTDSSMGSEEVAKQDNETQYDAITNEKGELVILTKKSVLSMTTAAITSQPLEVVTTVTNQLPAAFEKAREKGIFERLSSRDSLAPKDEKEEKDGDPTKTDVKEVLDDKDKIKEKDKVKEKDKNKEKEKETEKEKESEKEIEKDKGDDKKVTKPGKSAAAMFSDDNIKLKPLQPPFNNPHLERVRHKIDELLKEPEVSTENILTSASKSVKETKNTFKSVADKTKTDIKVANEAKDEMAAKLTDLKDQAVKQNDKMAAEIRSEATKIVNSIITPVEEPKELKEKIQDEIKKDVEPIVVVVNEKKKDIVAEAEKMTETLVKGEPEVEVQSSNVSTPGMEKMEKKTPKKMMDGNDSDKSTHSNGGFPQSTSTTPKPPARTNRRQSKEEKTTSSNDSKEPTPEAQKQPNICVRLMTKCKTKCCPCCVKGESDEETEMADVEAQKTGALSKLNCCKHKEENAETEAERAAGKTSTIEFESETKRKQKLRDIFCGCCGRRRRVSDVSDVQPRNIGDVAAIPGVVDTGCCGKSRAEIERRDSILSDRPPPNCCTRLCTWLRGSCRRRSEPSSSRRTSMFSKNKSLSPTLPPEDTRKKLDTSLVEHTSVMRGALPALPRVLAYFCLLANVLVPGLGTIFSGMFCLCFGIPRFGVHDGAKHRIGSFLINLLVGCGQLFTVLFCLVGWGWSIWWGVILVRVAHKYRKLKAEAAAEEAEAAPPVTDNNHTRA